MNPRHTIVAAAIAIMAGGASHAATVIYFDDFNDQQNVNNGGGSGYYTQTLSTTAPTVRNGVLGGSASATWQAGVEAGGWGQRDIGDSNVATPTSSNFLAFTPVAGYDYTVQMTVNTTALGGADPGGTNSWFTVGFTSFQHHWNGVNDTTTIDTGNLVRFNSNAITTITYTRSGADLIAAGIQYVGWITDAAGVVNLNDQVQVSIDNFSLTAVPEPTAAVLGGFGLLGLLRRRRR